MKPAPAEAAPSIGHLQTRTQGTVGGSLGYQNIVAAALASAARLREPAR